MRTYGPRPEGADFREVAVEFGPADEMTDTDRLEFIFSHPDIVVDAQQYNVASGTWKRWRICDAGWRHRIPRWFASAREALDNYMRRPLAVHPLTANRIVQLDDRADMVRLEFFLAHPRLLIHVADYNGFVRWCVDDIGVAERTLHEDPRKAIDATIHKTLASGFPSSSTGQQTHQRTKTADGSLPFAMPRRQDLHRKG